MVKESKFTVESSFMSRRSDFIAFLIRLVWKKTYFTISKLTIYKSDVFEIEARFINFL